MRSLLNRLPLAVSLVMICGGTADLANAQVGARVDNWTVPERASKATDITSPVTFIGMVPCRIVDTRGAVGPYGAPILLANTVRDFDLDNGPCTEIPPGVDAYSLNFTVTQTQGPGDLRVWPAAAAQPLVSTLNYLANQTLANAAIVPAGFNGAISVVAAVSGTHLIIDINGYFTDEPNLDTSWQFFVRDPGDRALTVLNLELSAGDSSGILGAAGSTGAGSWGVEGMNTVGSTNENGGVLGRAGPGLPVPLYGQAGVRGESATAFGVLGISRDSFGVAGSNVDGTGAEQTWGGLACSGATAVCGGGNLSISGSKSFVEPHPRDAARVIKFVSLEGNEAGTYFRGRGKFERGLARIPVPEEFQMVTAPEGLSIQVTPIGEMASYAVVRISLDEILVKASRNVEFFYTVNGVRRGYENFAPIAEEGFFMPRSAEYRMLESLSPEARRKLITNGTYNADGTVNMETARRLGWTEKWKGSAAAPKKD